MVNKLFFSRISTPLVCLIGLVFFSIESSESYATEKHAVTYTEGTTATELTPFSASYDVSKGRIGLGTLKRQLTRLDDNTYAFSYISDLSFLILSDKRKELSKSVLTHNTVQPLKYIFKREGTGSNRDTQLQFDPKSGNVIDLKLDSPVECEKHVQWLDQISYQLQLKLDLKSNKEELTYYVIDYKKRPKTYQFKVMGTETLTVPAGTFETIKLQRIRNNKKRLTEIWMIPELGHLIARIRQSKDDSEQADAQLKQVTFR